MFMLAIINNFKKFIEQYEVINFFNLKKFLEQERAIEWCSECFGKFNKFNDEVCALCLEDAIYLEKVYDLYKDLEYDMQLHIKRIKKMKR